MGGAGVEGGHWVGGTGVEVDIGWEGQVWRWALGGSGRCGDGHWVGMNT